MMVNPRNLMALVAALFYGCIAGFLVATVYLAFPAFVLLGLSALIVYGIAERKAIWVSVVPGITCFFVAGVVDWIVDRPLPHDILAIPFSAVLAAIVSFLIASPLYWLRMYLATRAAKNKTIYKL
jgi:hypothetical protein